MKLALWSSICLCSVVWASMIAEAPAEFQNEQRNCHEVCSSVGNVFTEKIRLACMCDKTKLPAPRLYLRDYDSLEARADSDVLSAQPKPTPTGFATVTQVTQALIVPSGSTTSILSSDDGTTSAFLGGANTSLPVLSSSDGQSTRPVTNLPATTAGAVNKAQSNNALSEAAQIGIGVGVGVGALVLICGAIIACLCVRRRRRNTSQAREVSKYSMPPQSDISVVETHTLPFKAVPGIPTGHSARSYEPYSAGRYGAGVTEHHTEDHDEDDHHTASRPTADVTSPTLSTPTPNHPGPVSPLISREASRSKPSLAPLHVPSASIDKRTPLHSRDPSPSRSMSPVSPISPVSALSRESSLRQRGYGD